MWVMTASNADEFVILFFKVTTIFAVNMAYNKADEMFDQVTGRDVTSFAHLTD